MAFNLSSFAENVDMIEVRPPPKDAEERPRISLSKYASRERKDHHHSTLQLRDDEKRRTGECNGGTTSSISQPPQRPTAASDILYVYARLFPPLRSVALVVWWISNARNCKISSMSGSLTYMVAGQKRDIICDLSCFLLGTFR